MLSQGAARGINDAGRIVEQNSCEDRVGKSAPNLAAYSSPERRLRGGAPPHKRFSLESAYIAQGSPAPSADSSVRANAATPKRRRATRVRANRM
jgi:hypothetical protein